MRRIDTFTFSVTLRYMWNNGDHLLWQHISSLYYVDVENGGKTLPKLTADHIKLIQG